MFWVRDPSLVVFVFVLFYYFEVCLLSLVCYEPSFVQIFSVGKLTYPSSRHPFQLSTAYKLDQSLAREAGHSLCVDSWSLENLWAIRLGDSICTLAAYEFRGNIDIE